MVLYSGNVYAFQSINILPVTPMAPANPEILKNKDVMYKHLLPTFSRALKVSLHVSEVLEGLALCSVTASPSRGQMATASASISKPCLPVITHHGSPLDIS